MNYEKAEQAFRNFVKNYDINHDKISRKINHTFEVVKLSEHIAKQLNLSNEHIELAKIVALLHDIGRFEQARVYGNFDDYLTFDHGEYGAKILLENNLIRKFVEDDKNDKLILNVVRSHNKHIISEYLTEEELLYSNIVRDADKLDNYRVALITDVKSLGTNTEEAILITQTITDEVFNDIMNCKSSARSKMKNGLDKWVSYAAHVFDFHFNICLKDIKEKNYINLILDRFTFKNKETQNRIEVIRECVNNYIEETLIK